VSVDPKFDRVLAVYRTSAGQEIARKRVREYRRMPHRSAAIEIARPDQPADASREGTAGSPVLTGGVMRAFLLAGVLALAIASSAEAGPLRGLFSRQTCPPGGCRLASQSAPAAIELPPVVMDVAAPKSTPATGVTVDLEASAQAVAQAKAETIAARGYLHHPGGSFAGGTAEGVGFSTASAEDAVSRCCFWGQRRPIGIGVARAARGWFAAVLYR
jgi:hypothetical protein